ncbi:MAG: zinc metallopeptidase (plasmid) [Nodularia sp. CChRGM 3473]
MFFLFYLFCGASIISLCMFLWWLNRHFQWRRRLEPFFNAPNSFNKTGREIARDVLDENNLSELPIRKGSISNDNVFKSQEGRYGTIYLNPEHYENPTLQALAVSVHECGHAINFNKGRSYLSLSKYLWGGFFILSMLAIVPLFFLSKPAIWWLFLLGAFPGAMLIVARFLEEKGATSTGIKMLKKNHLMTEEEKGFVKQYLCSNLLHYMSGFSLYTLVWNILMALLVYQAIGIRLN